MPNRSIDISIRNVNKIKKSINNISKESEAVLKRTTSDFKSRAPAQISQAVTEVYNIKKAEIKGSVSRKGKIGSIKLKGTVIDNVRIEFEGRLLTPTHFNMTPKKPFKDKRGYTLQATILKGKKRTIGRYLKNKTANGPYSKKSHNILMGTGAKTSDKISHIPFQRMSRDRKDIKKFTTVSVPQMITNKKVNKDIEKRINEVMSKRLDHHLQRMLK